MMTLARVVTDHPHAVQRELLCYGYSFAGWGNPWARELELNQFISFVLGAPPASALGLAVSDGWSKTDHLLANLAEQHAGLIRLGGRYDRPGVEDTDENEDNESHENTKETSKNRKKDTPKQPPGAEHLKNAILAGGRFDRFETPEEFEAKMKQLWPSRYQAGRGGDKT
jgi:hypothetical protein